MAGHFGASYKALFLCISREICTVPSLYRPSTDGLIAILRESAFIEVVGETFLCV